MKLPGQGRPGRAAAIVVTVAAFLVLAPSAFATTEVLGKVDGLKYVRASDTVAATNLSAASATVHANCGVSPWKTTGGGAAIDGAAGSSYLTESEDYVKRWYGIGWHYAQPAKTLRVFGICSKSSAISHHTNLASFATAPPPTVAATKAPCAQGHILGGGTLATIGPADGFINTTNPYDGADADTNPDDAWQAYMAVYKGSGSILVYGICRKGPLPAYRSIKRTVDDHHALTVNAHCQSGHVAGGGVYETGDAKTAHVVATRPIDTGDNDKIPDDGWSARVYNSTGITQSVTVTAICIG